MRPPGDLTGLRVTTERISVQPIARGTVVGVDRLEESGMACTLPDCHCRYWNVKWDVITVGDKCMSFFGHDLIVLPAIDQLAQLGSDLE